MMLFAAEPVFKNVTIAILDRIHRLWLRPHAERVIARRHVGRLRIRPPNVDHLLSQLSGGNQQKVALAKWLTHLPRVLVLSEPTRGMDVGAKDDVVTIVRELREQGIGIVVVSTEPDRPLARRPYPGDEEGQRGPGIRRRTGQQRTLWKPHEQTAGSGPCAHGAAHGHRELAPRTAARCRAIRDAARADRRSSRVRKHSFATLGNLQNILTQISVTGIIAVGLTFVILCAEIDLSVASVANATGIVVAYFTMQDASVTIANVPLPSWAAILIALAACLALGAVNAFGLTRIGIPSFIMTLAMLQIAAGICALLVRGQIAYAVPPLIGTLGRARSGRCRG